MDQQLRSVEAERLSPVEAEEVIKRFRDEEEQRQKEMEAQATNPTVADLAEGLGVPPERVARLLSEVRGGVVPPAPFRSEPISMQDAASVVRRSNQTAWIIAGLILGGALMLAVLLAMFSFSRVSVEQATPVPFETTEPPTPDAVAPTSAGAAGSNETATPAPEPTI